MLLCLGGNCCTHSYLPEVLRVGGGSRDGRRGDEGRGRGDRGGGTGEGGQGRGDRGDRGQGEGGGEMGGIGDTSSRAGPGAHQMEGKGSLARV